MFVKSLHLSLSQPDLIYKNPIPPGKNETLSLRKVAWLDIVMYTEVGIGQIAADVLWSLTFSLLLLG